MNAQKFNEDFEFYKKNLSTKLDELTVNLMLHAYCMGYISLCGHLSEDVEAYINVDIVLDKINELNPQVKEVFK